MQIIRRMTLKRRQDGASALEFAIVAPLLFFMLFAIVDLCLAFWVTLTMQYAVREGARYAITGRVDLDPDTERRQRQFAVIQKIKDSSMGLYDRLEPQVNGVAYGDPTRYTEGMFGLPGGIFVLQLDCTWPLLTPFVQPFFRDGKYTFSVAATARNEVFR